MLTTVKYKLYLRIFSTLLHLKVKCDAQLTNFLNHRTMFTNMSASTLTLEREWSSSYMYTLQARREMHFSYGASS